MCKGVAAEERNNRGGFCRLSSDDSVMCAVMISCELCGSRASLYCHADSAYLCTKCDRWVHEANFLARRHVRSLLCNTCQKPTKRYRVGVSSDVFLRRLEAAEETDSSRKTKKPILFL